MKNLFVLCSVVLLSSMFTSCRDCCQKAYEAESMYRLAKEGIVTRKDTTAYKNDFERIYLSMDARERAAYKRYREERRKEERACNDSYVKASKEVSSMLQD